MNIVIGEGWAHGSQEPPTQTSTDIGFRCAILHRTPRR
jgi:hypothetical protein